MRLYMVKSRSKGFKGSSPRLEPLRHYGLKKARDLFLKQAHSVDLMKEYYFNWRDDKNWMKGEKWTFTKKDGKRGIISEKVSWPLAKRGDRQYKENLKDDLSWIEGLPSEGVFNPTDRSRPLQQTNFLFVTWTTQVQDKFYSNREKHDIWREDSKICNRTLTRLRQHYGRVWYWRSNEGTKSGFPAPHGVLLFPDYTWNVRPIKVKAGKSAGKSIWRVVGAQFRELKGVLEGKDSRASPVAGFVDIQGIFNPRLALKHISKYCFGSWVEIDGSRSRKADIQETTYFWLWITRKHTYSNSRGFSINVQVFLKVFTDLTQRLLGISKVKWVYLEVCSAREAQEWDPDGLPNRKEIPWPSTASTSPTRGPPPTAPVEGCLSTPLREGSS